MRNLKKILALVLALVMSLSLMATASAADFTDASSINEKYETAVEVLEGLGVFRGYEDGSFQPTGSITRAETAAIIYRIVTGDVKDEQVSIYRDYNLFTDVPSTAWYAGYVNYCANAEYIKGVGGGKFNPNAQVTGYAALAMILRAIGYTANGGFTGPDWEVQTARVGESRKITKNILTGTLGQAATRETVAEILFQAILVDMVDHNVLHTENGSQGYTVIEGQTLGYKTFGLEQIEGVVMANEYANLNGTRVIGADKTDLQVAGEASTRRLDIGTKITDIGESRYAYVTSSKVLAMGDTGKNKVEETGAAVDISSAGKFAAVAKMASNADTEYYTNFDPHEDGHYTCDQRLEFSVVFYGAAAEKAFDGYKGIDISAIAAADSEWIVENCTLNTTTNQAGAPYSKVVLNSGEDDYTTTTTTPAYNYPVRYTKIIWAGKDITSTDLTVLESIFGTADNNNNNNMDTKRITGDVFVGTKSTNNTLTDEERDLSNSISYKKFYEEYIIPNTETSNWSVTWNGWWTKFVDNNGDGTAEYAFRTNYELAEALYTYTDRDGNTYIEFNDFDEENWAVKFLDGYTPAVGDKVLAAYIDGQMLVEPAKSEEVVVSSYSWRNDEITTDKGTYGQSGIINATDMMELISTMEDKITYVVYFDHFGYVRAYELPGGKQYALITEMYYTNGQQGNLVDSWPMTAELATLDADGKTVIEEYNVVSGASTFTAKQPWMRVENAVATYNYNNWLQPVIAHLGVTRTGYAPTKGTPTFQNYTAGTDDDFANGAYVTFWNANRQLVRRIATNGMATLEEFAYANNGPWTLTDGSSWSENWNVASTASFTNVAIVNIDGSNVSLTGAATLNLDKNAQVVASQPYATDYVKLSTEDIAKAAVRYPLGGDAAYNNANNGYVNAVHDTLYFIAYNGGVYAFKDYANFPGLTNDDNQIHAAYAVVRNTNSDRDGAPYWVADVIVYEVYDLDDTAQTSVSLAFYTPTRSSGNVQEIETLNSKYAGVNTLIPKSLAWSADRGQWGAEWSGYGFYALYNDTEPVDNVMEARTIARIGARDGATTDFVRNYGKNAIHAGIITREAYIDGAGEYIDVDLGNNQSASIEITDKIYSVTVDGSNQSDWWYNVNYATPLRYENQTNSQVRKGDHVIWVGAAKTDGTKSATNFVVDLGSAIDWSEITTAYCGIDLLGDTASFLIDVTTNAAGEITGIANYKDGVTYASGEWQRIMKEQYDNVNGLWDVEVVKYVDAAGNDITATATGLPALVSPLTVKYTQKDALPLVFATNSVNYKVTAVSVTSTNSKGDPTASVALGSDNRTWMLSNVTGDVELTVVVAHATYNVSLETSVMSGGTVAVKDVENNPVGLTAVPSAIPSGTKLTLTITPGTNATVYQVKVNDEPIAPKTAGGYIYEITITEDTEIEVNGVEYGVTLNTDGITNTAVASVMLGGVDIKGNLNKTTPYMVPANADLVLTVTPDPAYNYVVKVGGTTKAADAGNANQYTIKVTAATAIEITETAKPVLSTDNEPTSIKAGTVTATHTAGQTTYALSGLPYGVATASVVVALPAGAEIVEVWKGAAIYGTEVTVTANNTYTLDVGANSTPTTYVFVIAAENGDEANYTLTLEAGTASTDSTLTAKEGSGIVIDTATPGSEKITLPHSAENVITIGTLKGLLNVPAGATIAVYTDPTDADTLQNDNTVLTAAMKVVVTSQAGGANKTTYSVEFAPAG